MRWKRPERGRLRFHCSLSDGRVPRVVNLDNADAECDLACVRDTTDLRPANVLCTSAGFGGINAALVFRRADL